MGSKLENVISLYLDGVRDGHVLPAADKYLTDSFIDHEFSDHELSDHASSGRDINGRDFSGRDFSGREVAGREPCRTAGRDAFVGRYEPVVARYDRRAVWPLRGFEDGGKVLLHSYQTFGYDQRIVALEIFDTDAEDRITARWSVRVPLATRCRSGRSQIDGPHLITDADRTERNKRLVEDYTREVLVGGAWDRYGRYADAACAEHDPDLADGGLPARAQAGDPVRYLYVSDVVGCGSLVAARSTLLRDRLPVRVIDLYRVDGGRIVERWTVSGE